MARFSRIDRLNHQFKEEIGQLLSTVVRDPRIGFCTITRVNITSDLSLARVYVSVLGDEQKVKETMGGLDKSAGFIRSRLGQVLKIRTVPEIKFMFDKSTDYAMKINKIIDDLNLSKTDQSTENAG